MNAIGRPTLIWLAVVLALALVPGCGTGDDTESGRGAPTDDDDGDDDSGDDDSDDDDSGDDDSGDDDTGDDDSDDTTPPDPPFVYPPDDNPYPLDAIALKGIAEPNSTIAALSPVGQFTGGVDAEGDWCLVVGLLYDPESTIENEVAVRAVDDAGNESEPTVLSIWVDPELTPVPRNVAPDGDHFATSTHADCGRNCGGPDKAMDDSRTTYWENSTSDAEGAGWFKDPQWLMVDLGRNHLISGVKVTWYNSYGRVFRIVYSERIDPPNPDESMIDWVEIGSEDNGNGQEQSFQAFGALGRWVAVLLDESNDQNPSTDAYRYQVKELRVTGIPWDEAYPEPICP